MISKDIEEQSYRLLFDLANDGLIVLGLDGRIRDLNRTAFQRLGYAKEEMLGQYVARFVPPQIAERLAQRIRELLVNGSGVYESVMLRNDGSPMPIEINARMIELRGERCIFSVVRDVSERNTIEESLTLTQLAVDRSSDAVFWLDMQGRVLRVNDQACRSLGYAREELVGQHVWDFDPNFVGVDWPARMEAMRGKESWRHETTHRHRDGGTFPVEVIANRIRYMDKELIIAFVRDISERRRADAALRESEERLHQAIRVSHIGIFDHDHSARSIYWSPEQRVIYGIAADDPVTLESFLDMVHPEDRGQVWAAVQLAHDPGGDGLFDIQHRIVRRDGEIRWLKTRAITIFKGEGEARYPLRTVGAVMDITERRLVEEKASYLAFHDSLTGLANRSLLHDRLEWALAVSARKQLYGALLFIDLDHFKTINDTIGHEYGDLLLKEVARRLRAMLREIDTIARPGGDEFVVIIEQLDAERNQAAAQVKATSDKILNLLAKSYHLQGREYTGSASIGVVMFHGHEDKLEELLKRSDMAMYEAKRAGRGVVRFFDPMMQDVIEKRAALEADLRKAVELRQFELYYQVCVGAEGQALGAEALLRWPHRERGLVTPGDIIPLCEETGLILPIGGWVLETVCNQLRAWEADPATRALKISVNISASQFRQDGFVAQVVRALETTGIDPARLNLELTESVFMENIEEFIAKMAVLRGVGVLFSLDDFGTGYSSLSYLKKLPLSQVKIDRSFVRDIAVDKNDEIIVQTIIKMGQTLGLEVVAEGVETDEQRRMLVQYGCGNYQGYLFGKPVPVADFERALPNFRLRKQRGRRRS